MNHMTALVLALAIITVVLADVLFNGGDWMLFLAKKLFALIEYLAVWR